MRKCLVIDSSRAGRKAIRRIVGSLCFTCLEADDSTKALEICSKEKPDVVLLDWGVKGMGAADFIAALRASPGGEKPEVIFCTVEGDEVHIRKALEAGADEYIVKPFDHEMIEKAFIKADLIHKK